MAEQHDLFIVDQVTRIKNAQLNSANKIIASQQDIQYEINKLGENIEEVVSNGFESLRATFEWALAELAWKIELQTEVLKEILKVLQTPLTTQAKELRQRGDYAYLNGWIDDALEDFLESEKKNRYDFSIHQSLGNIFLFHKGNLTKALEYYDKAIKYATPKTSFYTAFALVHAGRVYYLRKNFEKAYERTLKAIEICPNLYEAHYQHAQYCTHLDKFDEAIQHLKFAIVSGDKYYCLKILAENDFNVMKEKIDDLFEELKNSIFNETRKKIADIKKAIDMAESYSVSNASVINIKNEVSEIENDLTKSGYFGGLRAYDLAVKAHEKVLELCSETLKRKISESEQKINIYKGEGPNQKQKNALALIGGFIVFIIIAYYLVQLLIYFLSNAFIVFFILLILLFGLVYLPPAIPYFISKMLLHPYKKKEEKRLTVLKQNLINVQNIREKI